MTGISKNLPTGWSGLFLMVGIVIYFLVNFQRTSVPGTIFNELQHSLRCSAFSITTAGTMFMYSYATVQLIAGLLVDKFGGIRVMASGCVVFCVGTVLFPFSENLGLLYGSRILTGLGAGTIYLSLLKEINRLFPQKFAMWNGIILLIGYSGGICATLPLTALVCNHGWRIPMAASGAAAVVAAVCALLCFRRSRLPEIRPGRFSLRPFGVVLTTRANYFIIGSMGILFANYYVFLAYIGKKFLEDFCGLAPRSASACILLMVAVSSLMNCGSGVLSQMLGNCRKPFLYVSISINLAASLMMMTGVLGRLPGWWFIMAYTLYALSSGFLPISNALTREVNPPESTGAAVSQLGFASSLLVALFGTAAGLVLDGFSRSAKRVDDVLVYPPEAYLVFFSLLLVFACAAMWNVRYLPETMGRNCYRKPEISGAMRR